MSDQVDVVARALFHSVTGSAIAFEELAQVGQDAYRRQAQAAIDALSITNQCGAPGDTFECPACSADWVAVDYGPLDIAWVRKESSDE